MLSAEYVAIIQPLKSFHFWVDSLFNKSSTLRGLIGSNQINQNVEPQTLFLMGKSHHLAGYENAEYPEKRGMDICHNNNF